MYSDNHPCMINFNANLVEVFTQKENPQVSLQITEKNLEIAQHYYGVDHIYTLKQELALASNYLSKMKVEEA